MRGARGADAALAPVGGIIPAYAGSTIRPGISSWRSRDHPRVCGEHTVANHEGMSYIGSSPRMRGAYLGDTDFTVVGRIIPAYAGSTDMSASPQAEAEDHPRVCGEHT